MITIGSISGMTWAPSWRQFRRVVLCTRTKLRSKSDTCGRMRDTGAIATLSGRMDDSVRLVKESGSAITVPIEKLSGEDQEFLTSGGK